MTRLGALLLAALAVAGCGKKGPPMVPESRLPQAVSDVRGEVRDGAIHLAWTNPGRRADNSRLRDLNAARVYRVEDPGVGDPKPALLTRGRIAGYTELATLRPAPAPSSGVPTEVTIAPGEPSEFTDRTGLTYGRRYTYVVLIEDDRGRVSPPSPRVTLTFMAPPDVPQRLTAVAGEQEVRLAWQPPARLADGSPVTGEITYEVLRALAADAPIEVVTPAPIAATTLSDRNLENDRTYHYAVRALRREGSTLARGAPTARVAATPRDLTPPEPPRELIATPAPGAVRLSWGASPAADVAAYVVYRAAAGGAFGRVGSTRAPSTVFLDRDVPPGTYRYAVTAQDSGVTPNESARSNEVTVTVP